MIRLKGMGVSGGYAIGTLLYLQTENPSADGQSQYASEEELLRFRSASEQASADLNALAERLRGQNNDAAAALMEAHAELAQDLDFTDSVEAHITQEGMSAESAVRAAGKAFADLFAQMEEPELQARAADVLDVADRICRVLAGRSDTVSISVPCVPAVADLSPSRMLDVPKDCVLAWLVAEGSAAGHAALLARSMGVPMVIGLGQAFSPTMSGLTVAVNGYTGEVFIAPDEAVLAEFRKAMAADETRKERLAQYRGKATVTSDGRRVKLTCNIQNPGDAAAVSANDGEGIGLFRSEFLFLNRAQAPSEEEQFEAYRSVLQAMNGKETVVRTVDIGADKGVTYLTIPREENPALGLRGLRLSLAMPNLFRTQLRALYRASVYGNLKVMFPMVSDCREVRLAKEHCREVMDELRREGIPFSGRVPLGIMIETPSAALISDALAREADFFSCGTNDLTQYTLACDRTAGHLTDYYQSKHPAVLKLLSLTVQNAHSAGIPVAVCGELAAEGAELLVNMGVDELSVPPAAVLPLRERIGRIGDPS